MGVLPRQRKRRPCCICCVAFAICCVIVVIVGSRNRFWLADPKVDLRDWSFQKVPKYTPNPSGGRGMLFMQLAVTLAVRNDNVVQMTIVSATGKLYYDRTIDGVAWNPLLPDSVSFLGDVEVDSHDLPLFIPARGCAHLTVLANISYNTSDGMERALAWDCVQDALPFRLELLNPEIVLYGVSFAASEFTATFTSKCSSE